MRVAVVVAAMLFCAPVFAQGVKLKSVTNSIGMELIEIPAGKFTMGGGGFRRAFAVTLTKPFGLGKTEVTQGQWKSVMGTEPWKGGVAVQTDKDCPAVYVSWLQAMVFCRSLTDLERVAGTLKADEEYHLPTEAQWEYACRAGTTTAFSFGDDEKQSGEYAWFNGNSENVDEEYAHKVGLKKPNPWGLYDMHGNVWEWCLDLNLISGGSDVIDPIGRRGGNSSARSGMRGGCWGNQPVSCQSANSYGRSSTDSFNNLGFRVARSQSAQ